MNKKLIRLTESDLHNIVKESVNKILNEWEYAGWINDIEDPIEYDPNDPESVKERETCNEESGAPCSMRDILSALSFG